MIYCQVLGNSCRPACNYSGFRQTCYWALGVLLSLQIYKYGRQDFIETDWRPAVEEARGHMMTSLSDDVKQLSEYRQRFILVQQTNKAKAELIGKLI